MRRRSQYHDADGDGARRPAYAVPVADRPDDERASAGRRAARAAVPVPGLRVRDDVVGEFGRGTPRACRH